MFRPTSSLIRDGKQRVANGAYKAIRLPFKLNFNPAHNGVTESKHCTAFITYIWVEFKMSVILRNLSTIHMKICCSSSQIARFFFVKQINWKVNIAAP